jgi:hypothetical protein
MLWNRTHLCICFVRQEDDLPSPKPAPKLVPKSEPDDSSPAKPTPSGHAQSATPSSKSTQKRKSGGGDANISNGAPSKKIKMEHVRQCLHSARYTWNLSCRHIKLHLHQVLCFKISLFLGIIGNRNIGCQGWKSVLFGTNFESISFSKKRIITHYRGRSQDSTSCNFTHDKPRSGVEVQDSSNNSRGRLLQPFDYMLVLNALPYLLKVVLQ